MLIKIIKILKVLSIIAIFSAKTATAVEIGLTSLDSSLVGDSAALASELFNTNQDLPFKATIVKQGEQYDETRDPALHKSSPPEEGPQHGYFAVSLLVISIVGVLLYFIKLD